VRSTIYWASRFACAAWLRHLLARSRRAIRSITFAPSCFASLAFSRYGGSASIPLASRTVAPEVRLGATAPLCGAFRLTSFAQYLRTRAAKRRYQRHEVPIPEAQSADTRGTKCRYQSREAPIPEPRSGDTRGTKCRYQRHEVPIPEPRSGDTRAAKRRYQRHEVPIPEARSADTRGTKCRYQRHEVPIPNTTVYKKHNSAKSVSALLACKWFLFA